MTIWTWLDGAQAMNSLGSATYPSARYKSSYAFDQDLQRFLVFGGELIIGTKTDNLLNDFWQYSVQDDQWKLISGRVASNNFQSGYDAPPARYGASAFYDGRSSTFFVFGGYTGDNSGKDLTFWKYQFGGNNSTGAGWSVVPPKDEINHPSSRYEAGLAFDAATSEAYLFGGRISGAEVLNDLWKYSVATNEWTPLVQSDRPNIVGDYPNAPGSRYDPSLAVDSAGRALYIYGGHGYGNDDTRDSYLNDLWLYDLDTLKFTFLGGSSEVDARGVNAGLNERADTNWPGARQGSALYYSKLHDSLFLFSGLGFTKSWDYQNDGWKFNLQEEYWTWISGSDDSDSGPFYAQKGNSSNCAIPGGRYSAAWYFDEKTQTFGLFGGYGYGTSSMTTGTLNDFWKFKDEVFDELDTSCFEYGEVSLPRGPSGTVIATVVVLIMIIFLVVGYVLYKHHRYRQKNAIKLGDENASTADFVIPLERISSRAGDEVAASSKI
jgi:hypothetical protein